MHKFRKIALSGALAVSAMLATAGGTQAQTQQTLCPDGTPLELQCEYTRDPKTGKIILGECKFNC